MALREDQIQRYSRQILLREVGGKGQLRLLEHGVEVEGRSDALDVAVAYLAASGTPLVDRSPSPRVGFLDGAPLSSFAPDAVADAPLRGWLGPLEEAAAIDPSRFRVGVGDEGLVAAPAGVPWPARAAAQGPEAALAADPVTLGALAALSVQRLALGLETQARSLGFLDGRWQPRD